jgi:transposase
MRASTAFNTMLAIPGASVSAVRFEPTCVVVGLRRRGRRPVCPCGWKGRAIYDRSVRRWRHLDLGGSRLFLEAEVRRLHCRRCQRIRTEAVPWARPAARHSRDLQGLVAFMAQRMDKTTITKLLRISWETVAKIVIDVVADHLDDARLEGLYRIGVDEVSYRKGHRYLTVVADHDRAGAVVWAKEGKDAATLNAFYDELGEARCAQLEAVSMDMGEAFRKATDAKAGAARQCVDPFHVVKVRQRSHRQGPSLVLEPGPAGESRRTATRTRTTANRLVATSPARQGPVGEAHPLGAAQRSRRAQGFSAGSARPVAP